MGDSNFFACAPVGGSNECTDKLVKECYFDVDTRDEVPGARTIIEMEDLVKANENVCEVIDEKVLFSSLSPIFAFFRRNESEIINDLFEMDPSDIIESCCDDFVCGSSVCRHYFAEWPLGPFNLI